MVLFSVYMVIEEVTALTNGTPGVVTIGSCETTKYEFFCHGTFHAANGELTIGDLTVYLDLNDERARPGGQVAALVAWRHSDQATQPDDWGNVGAYATGTIVFLFLAIFCLYVLRWSV